MEQIKKKPGRKPSDVKKSLLPLYLSDSVIEKMGGKKEARKKIYEYLQTFAITILLLALCTADSWFNF
jgi:hypothetical protein